MNLQDQNQDSKNTATAHESVPLQASLPEGLMITATTLPCKVQSFGVGSD
jgi:hypothetical protein